MSDFEQLRAKWRETSRRYREEHGDIHAKAYQKNTKYAAQKAYYQRNKERLQQVARERTARKKLEKLEKSNLKEASTQENKPKTPEKENEQTEINNI